MITAEHQRGLGGQGWVRGRYNGETMLFNPGETRDFSFSRHTSKKTTQDGSQTEVQITELAMHNVFRSSRNTVMEAIEKTYPDGHVEYHIRLNGIIDPEAGVIGITKDAYYEEDGRKRVPSTEYYAIFLERLPSSYFNGIQPLDSLPPEIDVPATIQAFVKQAREGNFQNPVLVVPNK